MIRVYMRCGKCGKYEDAAEVPRGEADSKEPRKPVMTSDRAGNPYYVMTPLRWELISLNMTQAVLCPDCVPDVIRQIEKAAQ